MNYSTKLKRLQKKYATQRKEILGKKKMAELNAIYEVEAAKQQKWLLKKHVYKKD